MDKNNKYYGLIEKLVRNHRKFPGYEAIIEDIIDDVYSHSEVIISSIDNESVVESYLEKVISTSIITVPKRLKFSSGVSAREVAQAPEIVLPKAVEEVKPAEPQVDDIVEKTEILEEEPVELQEEEDSFPEEIRQDDGDIESEQSNDIMSFTENMAPEKANQKFVDQMINTMNSDLVERSDNEFSLILDEQDNNSVEELEVVDETEESVLEEEMTEPQQEPAPIEESRDTFNADAEETSEEDSLAINDEIETLSEMVEDNAFTEDLSADVDVLDESGSASETILSGVDIETDKVVDVLETVDDEEKDEDVFRLDIQEEISDESDDNNLSFEETDDAVTLEEDNSDQLVDENEISLNIENEEPDTLNEVQDIAQESSFEEAGETLELGGADELVEEPITLQSEELMSIGEETEDLPIAETIEMQTEDLPQMDSDLQLGEELEIIESKEETFSDELSVAEEDEENFEQSDEYEDDFLQPQFEKKAETIECKAVDYAKFDYNPNDVQNIVDVNQISNKLLQLDSYKSDYNVLTIFDLRFKKNYTLEQISSELKMDKNDVVKILNEIVELV